MEFINVERTGDHILDWRELLYWSIDRNAQKLILNNDDDDDQKFLSTL